MPVHIPGVLARQLPSSALDAFSAAELACAVAACAVALFGGVFVVGVAAACSRAPQLRFFTSLWAPRLGMHVCGLAAFAALIPRLTNVWASPSPWFPDTPRDRQRTLCRLAVALPYGLFLPLLSALALATASWPVALATVGRPPARRPGGAVFARAALLSLPFALAQALICFHDPIFGARGGLRAWLPGVWLNVYVPAPRWPGASPPPQPPPYLCVQPLASVSASAFAAFLLGAPASGLCRSLARSAVSRPLARRARAAAGTLFLAPSLCAALRAVSALGRPTSFVATLSLATEWAVLVAWVVGPILALSLMPSVDAARAGAAVGWPSEAHAGFEPLAPAAGGSWTGGGNGMDEPLLIEEEEGAAWGGGEAGGAPPARPWASLLPGGAARTPRV